MSGEVSDLVCKNCGLAVELTGPPVLEPELRRAAHLVTGREDGPDGHLAIPVLRTAAGTPGVPFSTAGMGPAREERM